MFQRLVVFAVMIMLVAVHASAQDAPTATPEFIEYRVQYNDTLGSIAARYGVSVGAIMRMNDLNNAELIVIGQTLRIPMAATETPPPMIEPSSTPEELLPFESPTPTAPILGFDYGVEAFFDNQDATTVTQQIEALSMHWTKVRVSWRRIEGSAGSPDFTQLDTIIDALQAGGLNILLSVTDAPAWARTSPIENGPPDDFRNFDAFVGSLAMRYVGRVQAYEIWSEPNLRREWNNPLHPLGAESYAELLRGAYAAIKAVDPDAIIVSAGLAPTGFNDTINAIDDRQFLTRLYQLGLADMSDAIGAHPFGFANPPGLVCCDAADGVLTHYGHPSFYFLNTLTDYRQIMTISGDGTTLLWITAFGWGSSEDMDAPPRNSQYVDYNSLDEQAAYVAHALELGARSGGVGVMIIYNLNSCVAMPTDEEACYYSLIAPSVQPRPAYRMLSAIFAAAGEG